jgi:8-oxo-dGTP pyrophosphatase MutT (NUDIX family)
VTSDVRGRPERQAGLPIVEPQAAATLVVLRHAAAGLEVLLTRRAPKIRFAGGTWVFPGGRVDPADADHRAAAVRETAEETGVEVEPSDLLPLTRWVTPPGMASRFDTRFFAALARAGTEARIASPEVAAVAWLRPADALAANARGDLPMWPPAFVTLQQLGARARWRDVVEAFRPDDGGDAPPAIVAVAEGLQRVTGPWAGGVEGRQGGGWIVGRREWVVVDPGDPTGETSDAIARAAIEANAQLVGIIVRDIRPERHAGVGMFGTGMGLPIAGGIGASIAPYPISEIGPGERVPFGDVALVAGAALATAGEPAWAGAMSLVGPSGVLGA